MKIGVYSQIVAHLQDIASKHFDKKGDIKISVDQRCCPLCHEATFLGSVRRKSGSDWNEVNDLKFRYNTLPELVEKELAEV